jgi:hypothetical protein
VRNDRYLKGISVPRGLAFAMATTDGAFLIYWAASTAYVLGIADIPPAYLFSGYHDPRVFAWNWSFLPLDVAFSVIGFAAIGAARRGSPWLGLAIVSLVMSSIAGGMAISYWTILGEFDPGWYLPNLLLFLWPLFYLPGLLRALSR